MKLLFSQRPLILCAHNWAWGEVRFVVQDYDIIPFIRLCHTNSWGGDNLSAPGARFLCSLCDLYVTKQTRQAIINLNTAKHKQTKQAIINHRTAKLAPTALIHNKTPPETRHNPKSSPKCNTQYHSNQMLALLLYMQFNKFNTKSCRLKYLQFDVPVSWLCKPT